MAFFTNPGLSDLAPTEDLVVQLSVCSELPTTVYNVLFSLAAGVVQHNSLLLLFFSTFTLLMRTNLARQSWWLLMKPLPYRFLLLKTSWDHTWSFCHLLLMGKKELMQILFKFFNSKNIILLPYSIITT